MYHENHLKNVYQHTLYFLTSGYMGTKGKCNHIELFLNKKYIYIYKLSFFYYHFLKVKTQKKKKKNIKR